MEIVFVTREPEVCTLIASRLRSDTVSCSIQCDFLSFFLQLHGQKMSADLLVCDFCEFRHIMFDFYEMLSKMQKPISLIFYNDPYPDTENRVGYWISQNERLFPGREFHYLSPVFQKINELIEDPAIRPHISLLRPPVPLREIPAVTLRDIHPVPLRELVNQHFPEDKFDLNCFRLRNKMPPAIFSLFEFFYGNLSKEVSIKSISRRMSAQRIKNTVRKSSVYSYVSRLKKYIKTDGSVKFDIIRTSSGCYKMIPC